MVVWPSLPPCMPPLSASVPPRTAISIATIEYFSMTTVRALRIFPLLLLAVGLAFRPALRAEDKPAAPPEPAPMAQADPVAPAKTEAKPAEDKPVREIVPDDSKSEVAAEDQKADKPEKPHSEAPDGHRHRRSRHAGNNNERVSF